MSSDQQEPAPEPERIRPPAPASKPDPRAWAPPYEFEEYRLIRAIGRGSMGQVFLAHDSLLDRPVAVKFIAALDPDPSERERFLTEARAAARLGHPNVVSIHRIGEFQNRPYLVSEFIRGVSLDKVGRPMPWQEALGLGLGLARGLAVAHRSGVLHRDIKPANVMLADSGEVKLLDFGLAKLDFAARPAAPAGTQPIPVWRPQGDAFASTVFPCRAAPPSLEVPPEVDQTVSFVGNLSLPSVGALETEPGGITQAGAIMGTPSYMAPEIWRGEGATRRSDVYALGAVLYELVAGHPPCCDLPTATRIAAIQTQDMRPLGEVAPAVDRRFTAIVDRCLRRDADDRFCSGEELLAELEQLAAADRGIALPAGNPYRGLQPFDSEHRALFFGRQREIRLAVEMLRSQSMVVAAGSSGVGKSSLCRAGIVPHVLEQGLSGGRHWTAATMVPGKRPVKALAAALAPMLGQDEKATHQAIRQDPKRVARALRKRQGAETGFLLLIDQLEELVTLGAPGEVAFAGRMLAELADDLPGVRVLATLRADFIPQVAEVPSLGEILSRGLFLLRGLSPEGLRDAIVGPARAKGVRFETGRESGGNDGVVGRLVASSLTRSASRTEAAATLPLLQFALAELWEARDVAQGLISLSALAAIGGVGGALARHADGVLDRLVPAQRAAARHILMRLVTAQGTRARRSLVELVAGDPAREGALEALVRSRLVVAGEIDGGESYELAHEALITGWNRLHGWLDGHATIRLVKARLEVAAAEWERLAHVREALWGAPQLAELQGVDPRDLGAREASFLGASRDAVRRTRLARKGLAAGFAAAMIFVYGGIRLKTQREVGARVAAQVALAQTELQKTRAQAHELEGLRRQAFAEFDGQKQEAGERTWARALARSQEVERGFGAAGQAFEAALMLDGARKDVRARFGDAIYERALAAERDHRLAERDELLQRLALYDESGERRRRWSASGQVEIETSPAGARVHLERYVADAQGHRNATGAGELGATPLASVSLAPGSYRLTFQAAGRGVVHYPFVLGRGEALRVAVALPEASKIPSGFVYVPPGRFLFGSADEGLRASYLETVPLHPMASRGFLIGRDEVPFADWLAYLESLSPQERARHLPRSLGLTGAIELKGAPGSWRIALQPTTHRYEAAMGEKVRYRGRSRRQEQDWLQFPVSGISAIDAQAYARWLQETSRVPGARLCTEQEWERAARGADDREFPHGDALAPDDANFEETYGKQPLAFGPDVVGSHPASDSPFGVRDLSRNVWEWTESVLARGQFVLRGPAPPPQANPEEHQEL